MHNPCKKESSPLNKLTPLACLWGMASLYLSLFIPLLFTAYVPSWYTFNCQLHGRCEWMPQAPFEQRILELSNFLVHRERLSSPWTLKERTHLLEARSILDKAIFLACCCAVFVLLPFKYKAQVWWPKINIVIILLVGAVLPFFRAFWAKVFHPLFFSNRNWLNTYQDVSYYIMPSDFFKHTVLVMVVIAILLNLILHCFLKRRARYKNEML